MNQSSTKTKKKLQEQYLNLVFFVDTGKTRTFVFRMDRLLLSLSGVLLVLIWGLTSFWFLISLRSENKDLSQKLKSSMNTIIDYQTRYDGIYEKAYSNSATSTLVAKNNPEVPLNKESKSLVEETKPETVDAKADESSELKSIEKENLVQVQEFSFKLPSPNELITSFALKNTEGSNRATGRFWGIAIFQTKSGEFINITSPEGLPLGSDGQLQKPSKGTSFSIKFYRARELVFKAPQGVEGSFTKATIYVSDEKNRIASYPFPIQH